MGKFWRERELISRRGVALSFGLLKSRWSTKKEWIVNAALASGFGRWWSSGRKSKWRVGCRGVGNI